MNTHKNLALYLLMIAPFAFASCSGNQSSTTVKDSTSATTKTTTTVKATRSPAERFGFVIDSIGITDPDEKKVCGLYDEVMTAYLDSLKIALADTASIDIQKKSWFDKKYQEKINAIQPEIESLKAHYKASPMEAVKMMSFMGYEQTREVGIVDKYYGIAVKKGQAAAQKKIDSVMATMHKK
jgi:hypothetical protein